MYTSKTPRFFAGILIMAVCLFYTSCESSSRKNKGSSGISRIADTLFNKSFDIRHFNFGMAREDFDLGDDSSVLENERDFVVESINFKTDDSVFAECSYRFENNALQSAEINIFSPGDSLNKMVADTMQWHLNRIFGHSMYTAGYYTWKVKGHKGYDLEIFMADFTSELGTKVNGKTTSAVTQIQFLATLVEKPMLARVVR